MNEVVEVFVKRDGMSKAEACKAVQASLDETYELMTSSSDEAEEFWMSSTGLETDYLLGLI